MLGRGAILGPGGDNFKCAPGTQGAPGTELRSTPDERPVEVGRTDNRSIPPCSHAETAVTSPIEVIHEIYATAEGEQQGDG